MSLLHYLQNFPMQEELELPLPRTKQLLLIEDIA
jgi:hypothetical protein